MTETDPDNTAEALLSVAQTLAGELHPGRPLTGISLDSSLDKDFGLDSLGRVELLHRIGRRFDVVPPEALVRRGGNPPRLVARLAASQPCQSAKLTAGICRI